MSEDNKVTVPTAEGLTALLDDLAENTRDADRQESVRAFFMDHAKNLAEIGFASCRGGTQQVRNRIGQDGVQRAPELAFFFLKPGDNVESMETWLSECIRGETTTPRPKGPIAMIQPRDTDDGEQDHRVVSIVGARESDASRLVAELYGLDPIDPFSNVPIRLPEVDCFKITLREGEDPELFEVPEGAGPRPQRDGIVLIVDGDGFVVGVGQVDRTSVNGRTVLKRLDRCEAQIALKDIPSGTE